MWSGEDTEKLHAFLIQNKRTLALAESCSGGLFAHSLTKLADCSLYFRGGVIAYSNFAKQALLGVQSKTLEDFGAVSENVALEMASGVRNRLQSDVACSVTGIAGPSGGTAVKPVGMVCFAICSAGFERAWTEHLGGGRESVMRAAVRVGMEALWQMITS